MARGRARAGARRRGARRRVWWEELAYQELLDVRIRDLDVAIEGSALEGRVGALHDELERAGLRFRPRVWLSTGWFAPDGVTGFAIPFFLAHPRLARLERRQMLECEGGTREHCMRLLRHETAHALDNAYRLRRRKRWREAFGRASTPYRQSYRPKPGSRRHVHNLEYWYAQSHPLEDFAETFAVWLQPGSRWRTRYAGWPALRKLERVDELMGEIAELEPPVRTRRLVDPVTRERRTLGEYYRDKKARYDTDFPAVSDFYLRRIFSDEKRFARRETAAAFLRRARHELVRRCSELTGQHPYLVDNVLDEMVFRARALSLHVTRPEREGRADAAVLLAALTMNLVHGRLPEYRR